MGAIADTSWWVAVERRNDGPPFDPDELSTSSVTVAELRLGVELADAANRARREAFVERVVTSFPVLPFGVAEARTFARLSAFLRRAGTPIGDRDLMIAATAVANGLPLITLNRKEFERVPGLELIDSPIPGP